MNYFDNRFIVLDTFQAKMPNICWLSFVFFNYFPTTKQFITA